MMRDLNADLMWLLEHQDRSDLSDAYLKTTGQVTRENFQNYAPDFEYGITFVETTIAREWLDRAIKAEG